MQESMVLKEYDLTPTCGITWVDHYLIVTHYLPVDLNLRAPGFVLEDDVLGRLLRLLGLRGQRPLAQKYENVYSFIAESAESLTQARIDSLIGFRRTLDTTEPSEAKIREELQKPKT